MRLRTMPENQAPCAACSLSCRMLVLLFCTVRKPALAHVVSSKRKLYTMGPQHLPHLPHTNNSAWVPSNTYPGGLRSRLASDLYNVRSILLRS
jgi:hypothetical protein